LFYSMLTLGYRLDSESTEHMDYGTCEF